MEGIILYLEWGDEDTATMAKEFVRVYIWSYLLGGVSSCLWQLLEVTDHCKAGTIVTLAWGATNMFLVGILVTTRESNLRDVGMVYILTAFIFVSGTYYWANRKGWLLPFKKGLFHQNSFKNGAAVKLMIKQAVPVSCGYFFSNAEVRVVGILLYALQGQM